jgi:hypothetical protein
MGDYIYELYEILQINILIYYILLKLFDEGEIVELKRIILQE